MVTTTSWREVLASSAASFCVRSALVSPERIPASSTTRPLSLGKLGSAGNFGAAQAGAMTTRKASKAAASRMVYGLVVGAVAPGKLTTGADCAAALAAKGVACLYD